ncbi:MAG: DNA repair protein RecO [Candidatus Ryanbacteria bacterium RIFCSPLOWO2_02_FULL_45_11c]|uniref:DNA repair protein RecO n=1 Tax=Candidatus Ryanbacteria bacterium RIFCSPLOWO2_02_FULL_45_11c TaxID=1802128 RepID=A0A1G2GU69_9BACT|nr:MAG: DNA repair protein RecO [Candidatus Ryanbacteria bacterium RIFCSPLOWO2_02_FULL_45_11c]
MVLDLASSLPAGRQVRDDKSMSYQLHQTEGIVLKRWSRGEGDAVLRLYTRDYGGVTLVAKGIRLEKSKLRGAVDLFSQTHVGFIAGKETYRLVHADLCEGRVSLHEDFLRYRAAGYVADLFCRSVADGQSDHALWLLLQEAFSFFSGEAFQEKTVAQSLHSFEIKFLNRLGYLPETMPHVARMMVSRPLGSFTNTLSFEDVEELSVFLRPLLEYALTQRWEDAPFVTSRALHISV